MLDFLSALEDLLFFACHTVVWKDQETYVARCSAPVADAMSRFQTDIFASPIRFTLLVMRQM
jgi:hypothetical protein